jgi:2,6-dihydroxypseudooxynicotine hydrolase
LLRLRSAAILPSAARARFAAMGIPEEWVAATLRDVHRLEDWSGAWTQTAQRFLGEARREDAAGRWDEAARARQRAALCYHIAQWLVFGDQRTARALRASAASLFAQTLPLLISDVKRVTLRWRATEIPGYLHYPSVGAGPRPLAVLLNGSTTAKEETTLWTARFREHGIATLALDWPGTGEASEIAPVAADSDDITDSIFGLTAVDPALDGRRVALVGISLGGALAVRAAALDRRVAACVAVTPPFDATRWLSRANPILLDHLAAITGDHETVERLAADFALGEVVRRLRCPVLVLGAGRDLIVPPDEAMSLAAAIGPLATLVWYPYGSHALYDLLPTWTNDVARWLSVLSGEEWSTPSTQVDNTGLKVGSRQ